MPIGTITVNRIIRSGNITGQMADITIQGDDTYTAGGSLLFEKTLRDGFEAGNDRTGSLSNLALLGLTKIDSNTFMAFYDVAADALIVRNLGDGAQIGDGDKSGDTYRVIAHWG